MPIPLTADTFCLQLAQGPSTRKCSRDLVSAPTDASPTRAPRPARLLCKQVSLPHLVAIAAIPNLEPAAFTVHPVTRDLRHLPPPWRFGQSLASYWPALVVTVPRGQETSVPVT